MFWKNKPEIPSYADERDHVCQCEGSERIEQGPGCDDCTGLSHDQFVVSVLVAPPGADVSKVSIDFGSFLYQNKIFKRYSEPIGDDKNKIGNMAKNMGLFGLRCLRIKFVFMVWMHEQRHEANLNATELGGCSEFAGLWATARNATELGGCSILKQPIPGTFRNLQTQHPKFL